MTDKIKVRYVGAKPKREDSVAGTGVVWIGNGDVQEVPAEAWDKLKRYPAVWMEDKGEELPADIAYALTEEHSQALRSEEQEQPSLTERFALMTDEEVRAYVDAAIPGTKLHHKLSGDNLRARALEALKG